jgi:hypothetical protein
MSERAVDNEKRRKDVEEGVDLLLSEPMVQHLVNSMLVDGDDGNRVQRIRLLAGAAFMRGYSAGEGRVLVTILEKMLEKTPKSPE